MQQENQAWIALFHRIPEALHNTLVLGLHTGAEIVLQTFIKLEPDFMVVRGRVSGTQDSGRIIMIPYGQLTYVASTKLLKDTEVEAIFGKGAPIGMAEMPVVPTTETDLPSEEAPEEEEAPLPKKPDQPSKTALLAKLRDRLKESK